MRDAETQQLVDGAVRGDDTARSELLERLRPRIVLWCSSTLPASLRALYDAEDVTQDILLAVHGGLAEYRGTDVRSFHAWMFRIGENRIRDLLDHAGAQKRRLPRAASFSQTSPSAAAARVEELERVRRALETLPADHRDVIRMRRIEELEVPEIAKAMGRSENAVRILYCRALASLREALGEQP